jgi:DNA-binding beta-propeller fold protein YncE
MKTKAISGILLLFLLACEKDDVSRPESIAYDASYPTASRPVSILYKELNRTLYVANGARVEVFDMEGIPVKTVVDMETFDSGFFERYQPRDIAFDDNRNLYILAKPYQPWIDETWFPVEGFCILQFDDDDRFRKEFDFTQADLNPSSIAFFDNHLFVTDGRILKQIDPETQHFINISLPVSEDDSGTWPHLHVTDMEIDRGGMVYFTGQAAFNNDSVGCHISGYDLDTGHLTIRYAKGWTRNYCAMFNNPGLFISSDGFLYLASFYKMSIEVYDSHSDFVMECDTRTPAFEETRPIDIVYANSKIYVADHLNDQVHLFNQK